MALIKFYLPPVALGALAAIATTIALALLPDCAISALHLQWFFQ